MYWNANKHEEEAIQYTSSPVPVLKGKGELEEINDGNQSCNTVSLAGIDPMDPEQPLSFTAPGLVESWSHRRL